MALKQFKTESKRLLDLMANSIYTNSDIFLRELISNAKDALDKKRYLSLTNGDIDANDLKIKIEIDKDNRLIIIEDNGIGMDKDDLENTLSTIAKSGSFEFKQDNTDTQKDIIGQFGVGFYSAFMVADNIEVETKKINQDNSYLWSCESLEGYEIKSIKKQSFGTTIKLHIKQNSKEKKYDNYLDENFIKELIKKYSDFIDYPIVIKDETVNSLKPLWKKDKKDIAKDDYKNFYQNTYFDFIEPLKTLHYKIEGNTSYSALLYIPAKRANNFYTQDYKLQLSLYSKGVFIKDEAKEIISDHFRFIKGVVDSDDLNLNISREILQQDYQMAQLKKSIDKKIKSTLTTMLEKEREKYETFFDNFGTQLKFGVYQNFGENKKELIDLVMFKSSKDDKYVTLKEYVSNMKEGQNEIYYAPGETLEQIKRLPQIEKVLAKGYEVLYFTDNVDEFMSNIISDYDQKKFKSIVSEDINLDSEDDKKKLEELTNTSKDIIEHIKEVLKDKVVDVKLTNSLISYPVCLVSKDGLSFEMEKTLKALNPNMSPNASKVLEINIEHEIFKGLISKFNDKQDVTNHINLLYDEACLIAGLEIENKIDYTKRINQMIIDSLK